MAMFDELTHALERFSGKVRVFPLPNLVLFPHVMQPLRVFEPRYRELLEHALAGDRLVAMAMLAPGWEANYEGRPLLYAMACLGHITTYHRLADGTYNVLLLGVRRIRLVREIKPLHQFREAMVELCDDHYPASTTAQQSTLRRRLCEAVTPLLPSLPEVQEQVDQLLGDDVPLGVLTDVIGYMLDSPLAAKQRLLSELNVCRRAELLLTHLAQAGVEAADRASASFPPAFSVN
ncbi:MAG: LON peptidase substrate-binding domain-containing protein [Planctomycetaceae bacterium]|nr:LON peptidase substrate-binding domain-containing protein [Planctomycetaceae bacterium]